MMDVEEYSQDSIKERLDSVSRRLARPQFLQNISCSRLPSQAASDSSLSPVEVPNHFQFRLHREGELTRSPLYAAVEYLDDEPQPEELQLEAIILAQDFRATVVPSFAIGPQRFDKLQRSFIEAWKAFETMASDRGYSPFEHGHNDMVLAVDFNFYGTRMVTASSDHRLKVWDRKDETWNLVDTWRAHDAEVVDAKWNGPFMGEILGSISEDGRFKLWEEDILETPHSSRRFKCIYNARSETKVPFASLDFKNIHTETYVALITRDGYLTVYEPIDHDNLGGEWIAMMQKYVCATPGREEETGFTVCFHKEKIPCWTAVEAGLDRKALSLAISAMNTVKIFRTDRDRKWYVAVDITGARNIIRDVAWANGSMRGYDVIATASKDGSVRIYDITTLQDKTSTAANEESLALEGSSATGPGKAPRNTPSGIGAGLASASRSGETYRSEERNAPGRIQQVAKKVAELNAHGGPVWRVAFSQLGDLLVSTGDDGAVRTWKKALNGQWMEYAQVDLAANDP